MSKKDAKKTVASQAVIMAPIRRPRLRKRMALLLGVLLFIVAAGIVAAYLIVQHNDDTAAVATPAAKRAQTLQDVSKLNDSKNYAQEADALQKYLDTNPPAEYASQEIIRMAAAYMNDKNYDAAIKALQTALDKYPDSKLAALRGLGFAYMKRGNAQNSKDDYRKAIDYFNQAVTLELASPEMAHVAGSDRTNIRYLEDKLQ